MIENVTVNDTFETVLIKFGQGDIQLGPIANSGSAAIALKNTNQGKIGRKEKGGNINDIKPEVIISFDNQASLNAVISELIELKTLLYLEQNKVKP